MKDWQHERLPTFGVGQDQDERQWKSIFRQLAAAGLIQVDMTEHGALQLTEDARAVLKGERRVTFRRSTARKLAASKHSTGRPSPTLAALAPADVPLFETLRRWRSETAREQGVPAYIILVDRTLRELAEVRPTSHGMLSTISGMGSAKIEHYGEELLALIREAG